MRRRQIQIAVLLACAILALGGLFLLAGSARAQFMDGTHASPIHTGPVGGATATPTACTTGGAPAPWAVRSPAPTDFEGGAATADGTFAYTAGGYSFSANQTLNQFLRYNPATDAWATLSPMPQAAMMASAVYAPNVNKIFVFGGEDATAGTNYNITRIYDVTAGTWTTGANMPAVRSFMAAGYFNTKIYLVGGYTTDQVTSAQAQVWEYDPVANTFSTTRLDMPQPLGGAGSAVVNGHLYVIGGRDGTTITRNQVYDYNITANTWATRTAMPVGDNVPGTALVNGTIWIFGGGSPFSGANGGSSRSAAVPATTNITQIYDPAADSWSTGPNLNQARSFAGGTAVGAYAVAIGGYTGTLSTNSTETSLNPSVPCGSVTATFTAGPSSTATATAILPTATRTTVAPSATATTVAPSATATTVVASPTGVVATATGVVASPTSVVADPTPTGPPATASATPPPGTPTATPTLCPITFTDVFTTDYFYEPVRYLYCHGVISGYGDNTFRPYNDTTRAQMVKIVVLGFGYAIQTPAGGNYTFHDVPPTAPFWDVIETAAAHNIVSGYNCGPGGPGPCDDHNRGYFLPNNPVTRGQLSKIDVIAAGWAPNTPATPTFTDVPACSVFYTVIETAVCHGVVSGYADHTFHPFANATRGQISKIVYLSITGPIGSCIVTPAAR
jgi:hypothetical protein